MENSEFKGRYTRSKRRGLTIYRKCRCGETAHDFSTHDPLWEPGTTVYRCRNCRAPRVVKHES